MDASKIEDFLECAICLEQLDERSRVLPCQHTFCVKCLGIIIESKGHLQCPECRSNFPGTSITDLPRNVLLVRILEGLKTRRQSAEIGENAQQRAEENSKRRSKRLSAKVKCDALLNQPTARGLYNFNSNEEGDLPFCKGDIITLVHEIDDNWLEGILKGKRGSIPKVFVEILVPIPKIDDELPIPYAQALYSYERKEEVEIISFREGDIISVIKKVDDNWLEGILGGQYGIFPVNFMKLNKAAQNVMNADSSSSSGSACSSDEDADNKPARKSRRSTRAKKQCNSPWVKQPQSSAKQPARQLLAPSGNAEPQKRHTIHIENPNEQERQSRRALNLSDDVDQPQERMRAQSQGRRASESSVNETRSLASTVLLSRALRDSDDQLPTTFIPSVVPVSMTTSVANRTSMSLTFSNAPSTNIPSPLGPGESYTALFTYSPAQDDELALIQGDQYFVIEKHLDGWYKGVHIRSRQSGVFPGNYVKPSSQVTQQMLRNIASSPARNVIGYGSNPSSPVAPSGNGSAFAFPPPRGAETPMSANVMPCSTSPSRSSGFGLLKKLKKNKSKRPQPPVAPAPATTVNTTNVSPPPTNLPPSYYHSSMPAPAHHRLSRPSPMVPAEPPPPYTPSPETDTSSTIISTESPLLAEKFRAIATYPGDQNTELSLRVGDILYVTKKHADGWYTGKSTRTGNTGIFPSMFVEACT